MASFCSHADAVVFIRPSAASPATSEQNMASPGDWYDAAVITINTSINSSIMGAVIL